MMSCALFCTCVTRYRKNVFVLGEFVELVIVKIDLECSFFMACILLLLHLTNPWEFFLKTMSISHESLGSAWKSNPLSEWQSPEKQPLGQFIQERTLQWLTVSALTQHSNKNKHTSLLLIEFQREEQDYTHVGQTDLLKTHKQNQEVKVPHSVCSTERFVPESLASRLHALRTDGSL